MTATLIFPTENGSVFNLRLDPGYCFAMCLDVARLLLTFAPTKAHYVPSRDQLNPGKWALVQSAYEINNESTNKKIIEAQGMDVTSEITPTSFAGDFGSVAARVTGCSGTAIFVVSGAGGAHALLWFRDDATRRWLYLDPEEGLWQFDSRAEGESFIAQKLGGPEYSTLNARFYAYSLELS